MLDLLYIFPPLSTTGDMEKEEITPSGWQIMEVLRAGGTPLTSAEVYKRMQGFTTTMH